MSTPNPMFLELEHIPLKIGRMVIEPPPDKSPMFLIYNIHDPRCLNTAKKNIFQFYKVEEEDMFLILIGSSTTAEIRIKPKIEFHKSCLTISFVKALSARQNLEQNTFSTVVSYTSPRSYNEVNNLFNNILKDKFTSSVFLSLVKDIVFVFDYCYDKDEIKKGFDKLRDPKTKFSITEKYVDMLLPPNKKTEHCAITEAELYINKIYSIIIKYLHEVIFP